MITSITQKIAFTLFVLLLLPLIHAQNTHRISHLRGTQTINGVKVTVTQEGAVDSLYYCGDDTGPYFCGNDYSSTCCNTGSYIFTFSQTVKDVFLNISALSTSSTYDEEAEIYVNGVHYRVTDIGKESGCEPIAIISAEGNIRPCINCTGSGADMIRIRGPIKTLKVTCKINSGQPQGMVVGVYMGEKEKDQLENTLVNYTASLIESSAGKEILIESNQLEKAFISLKNGNGIKIPLHYRTIETNKIILDASNLAKGEYVLEFNLNDELERQKILID